MGKGWSFTLSNRDLEQINSLLHSKNLPSIYKVQAREYNRVNVNRKTYTTRYYSRMKKRDNSTIAFMSNPPSYQVNYGKIEKLFAVADYQMAFITTLKIIHRGLPHKDADITPRAAEVLFNDYLYFEESNQDIVFVYQIFDICCNLSLSDCNVLSWFANNIEHE